MRNLVLLVFLILTGSMGALSQKIGIGTSTPIARLEVKGEASTGTTNNLVLKNSNGDTLLRMRNDGRMNLGYNGTIAGRPLNIGGIGLNLYSDDYNLGGAIFPTDSSMVLWSDNASNKYVILQPSWGKVGIGTNSPKAKFHVRNSNASVATPVASAIGVFEDNEDVSISLLTPSDNASAIYFGNEVNSISGGIVYNSPSVNGLAFRTNGNVTRAVINNVGDMGIGDSSPNARLHVSDGTGGAMYYSAAEIIIEDNSASYLQFSTTTGSEAGLLSGNEVTSIRSAIIFEEDSSLQLRTGGNVTRMVINKIGNVGIGTTAPAQKLDVSGNGLFTGTVTASCGVLSCSDIRYKKNISPLKNSLASMLMLHGIYYEWDREKFPDKNFNGNRQIGIAAQELETVFPEMVQTDSEGYKTVDYSRLTPVLLEAMKEQQLMINAQQKQIEILMREMTEMKKNN